MAKTMETSRDDEHEEDVVPRSRFKTLSKGGASGVAAIVSAGRRWTMRLAPRGRRCRHCPTALLRGTWRGRRQRWNGGYICYDNNNNYIQR